MTGVLFSQGERTGDGWVISARYGGILLAVLVGLVRRAPVRHQYPQLRIKQVDCLVWQAGQRAYAWHKVGAGTGSRDGTRAGQGQDTNEVGAGGVECEGRVGFSGFLNIHLPAPAHCCIAALLSSTSLPRTKNSKTAQCENIQTVTLYL